MWTSTAAKSDTMNLYPSFGTNAVRMSSERTSGTELHIMEAFFYVEAVCLLSAFTGGLQHEGAECPRRRGAVEEECG